MELARTDLIAFGKLFLAKDFCRSETPFFHREIAKILFDTADPRQIAIFVPRGYGKTSLVKAFIIHSFCFRGKDDPPRFIGWAADSLSKSYANLEYISKNITRNPRIHRYFPDIAQSSQSSSTWTKQEIQTIRGDKLVCRSNAKSLRGDTMGSEEGAIRYWRIFLDDIENEETVATFEARQRLKDIVYNAVFPSLDNPNGRMVFTQTPVHFDSLCMNIITDWKKAKRDHKESEFSWRVIYRKAANRSLTGDPLWPSYFPIEKLTEIRKFYEDSGRLNGFYQEYMLEAIGEESRVWTRDHYTLHDAVYSWDNERRQSQLTYEGKIFPVNCFLGCDPATDINTKDSDYSVIMVIAMDMSKRIFVLEYIHERSIPQMALRDGAKVVGKLGVVDYIFDLYDRYHCVNGTVEDVGMTRGILQDLEAMKRTKMRFDVLINPEEPGGKEKLNKIKTGLNSFFAQRLIHVRESAYELREEIENFSSSMPHDDCVPPWSLIQTDHGKVPISNIRVGDRVLTHTGQYKPVLKIGSRFADKVYKVESTGKLPIYVTNNHKMYLMYGEFQYKYSIQMVEMDYARPVWKNYDEIVGQKKGWKNENWYSTFLPYRGTEEYGKLDLLPFGDDRYVEGSDGFLRAVTYNGTRPNAKFNKVKRYIDETPEFMYLLGYWLAEGTYGAHNVSFASHTKEVCIRQIVKAYFSRLGFTPCEITRGNSTFISFGSVLLNRFFRAFGTGIIKKLPYEYMNRKPEILLNIAVGWFVGDGTLKKSKHHKGIKGNTVSEELANQMFSILTANGFSPVIRKTCRLSKGFGNDQWIVSLRGSDANRMKNLIPKKFWSERGIELVNIEREHSCAKVRNGYLVSKIRKITEVPYNDIVMNLEVADDHSYVVENTIVHNCIESLFFSTRHCYPPIFKGTTATAYHRPRRKRRWTTL